MHPSILRPKARFPAEARRLPAKLLLSCSRERQGTPEAVAEAQGLREYLVRASLPLLVDELRTSDVVLSEIWRDSPSWA